MRPGSRKSGESGSSLSRLTTARSASRRGSTAGSRTSGRSSEATSTGTPAAASARRSGGMLVRPERTSTAISVPGDAVLEVRAAQQVGEALGLGALGVVGDDLDPAVALRPRHGLGRAGTPRAPRRRCCR